MTQLFDTHTNIYSAHEQKSSSLSSRAEIKPQVDRSTCGFILTSYSEGDAKRSTPILVQRISISLCVCRLSLHRGCCITHSTVSAILLPEQGCRKKCRAGSCS